MACYSSDAAVVSRECVDGTARPRTVDYLEAVNTQTTHGDGVVVMPSLAQEQHVDQLSAAYVE